MQIDVHGGKHEETIDLLGVGFRTLLHLVWWEAHPGKLKKREDGGRRIDKVPGHAKKYAWFPDWSLRWKLFAASAWLMLAIFRVLILIVPFNRMAGMMGRAGFVTGTALKAGQQSRAETIGTMIRLLGDRTPWVSTCYTRALTAQAILWWMKTESTIYFGIRKEAGKGLCAHAWLRCGTTVILGESEMQDYITVKTYAKQRKS